MTKPSIFLCAIWSCFGAELFAEDDPIRQIQTQAITDGKSSIACWGTVDDDYTQWKTHSNRLIPVYTFGTKGAGEGIDLSSYTGQRSAYRTESGVRRIYGRLPERTVNPDALYMDQTNIADIQRAAIAAGRRHVFLIVFDGMDYETTRAAAIYNQRAVTYSEGKGTGTHFQIYDAGGTAQYGFMVTSPHNHGTKMDVDLQKVTNPGGETFGGYDPSLAGSAPWETPSDLGYMIAKPAEGNPKHAYTDSSSSATSMTTGAKTFNDGVTVGPAGELLSTVAHEAQELGYAVGVVSSVPISHATPACTYAHNVSRDDYQDISRDLLGMPSIAHPHQPLPGMDVVIGGGFGTVKPDGKDQGTNFEPGNVYLADSDLKRADIANGGKYVTAVRTSGRPGREVLHQALEQAKAGQHRLLGFFGVGEFNAHLPYRTANGDYAPVKGNAKKPESYSPEDVSENPTLAEMTVAAISHLEQRDKGFWLMIEAGDVDWANHDNNLDCSIGAVNSGDAAVKTVTDWVEAHSNWSESLLIVTADHGHLLRLLNPEALAQAAASAPSVSKP